MSDKPLKLIVEALLMAAQEPLTMDKIKSVFPSDKQPTSADIEAQLYALEQDYQERAIELKRVASGFRIQTRPDYHDWIMPLFQEKPAKYSKALLEILAIIAYKQPVTRADIEDIRGVAVNTSIIKTLLEREWIRIGGYREVPGKPAVYVTTKQFLDYFNLTSIRELPPLVSNDVEAQTSDLINE